MFKTRKPEVQPAVSADRVSAIAAKVAPKEYSKAGGRGRRATRETVYKQGRVTTLHGEKVPVVIKSLSETGCRVEYFRNAPLQGRVHVSEPSVPLSFWADVVWQGEGCSGLRVVPDSEIN